MLLVIKMLQNSDVQVCRHFILEQIARYTQINTCWCQNDTN